MKARAGAELIHVLLSKRELAKAVDLATALPASQGLPEFIQSEMNFAKLKVMAAQQRFKDLEEQLAHAKLNKLHKRYVPYFRALIAEDRQDFKIAEKEYMQATLTLPYDVEVIINIARFFQLKLQHPDKAYQVLVEAVRANQESIPLWQAYCQQSLIAGHDTYANDALEQIRKISPEEYATFKPVYEKEREKIREARQAK
jgi:hypothetical protein